MSADLRELLQLAAKAIGGTLSEGQGKRRTGPTWDTWEWYGEPGIVTPATWKPYGGVVIRPHLDDGDSRRLQVACRIGTRWAGGAWLAVSHDYSSGALFGAVGRDGPDEAAALRRAVLRAAAEIGRRMP